jgi:DNA-nicking Smr family endonuclease
VFGSPDPLLDARPEATLDLHGDTALEAERTTHDFIATHARVSGGSIVHVITGRGRGSTGRPVLPGAVLRVLRGSAKQFIADFERDLDDGGFLVRLR